GDARAAEAREAQASGSSSSASRRSAVAAGARPGASPGDLQCRKPMRYGPQMSRPPSTWDEHYAQPEQPWDTGVPDPALVAFVTAGGVKPSRCLEIGAGTGTNALWLAEQGFDVTATDVSPRAVAKAEAKLRERGGTLRCRFLVHDILAEEVPGG